MAKPAREARVTPPEALVRRYYAHFFARETDEVLSLLSPDFVHQFNQLEPARGLEPFREFIAQKERHYSEEIEDLVIFSEPTGTRVAAEFFVRGAYVSSKPGLPEATNQPYRIRVTAVFEIGDLKITRLATYFNLPDWYRQIGAKK